MTNAENEFTQRFIQLGGKNFGYFNSCFSLCLKELCYKSNVTFRFLHCVLVLLLEPSKEANLELAMLDSRVGVKLAGYDCALVNFLRSCV